MKVEELLAGIYDGSITEYDLPESLYLQFAEILKKAVYKGYGGALKDFEPGGTDYELLAELRENVYMFSAAKTFQEVKEISSLLVGDNGELRSAQEFNELGRATYELWNDVWGETERNTAIGQAQNAVKWNQIEAEKTVLKVLRYTTTENACDICSPLEGFTAPVDDPAWDAIAPMNHFGCLCVLEQLEEGETTKNHSAIVEDTIGKMNPTFIMNPGKDKVIFSDAHPYFDVAKKDKGFAEKNFGLPIPDEDE